MAAKHEADNRVNIGQSASGRSFSMCPESEVSLQKHNLQNTNSWANKSSTVSSKNNKFIQGQVQLMVLSFEGL